MNLILCLVCLIYMEIFYVCSIMYTDHSPICLSVGTKVSEVPGKVQALL